MKKRLLLLSGVLILGCLGINSSRTKTTEVIAEEEELLYSDNFDGKSDLMLGLNYREATGNPVVSYSVVDNALNVNSSSTVPNAYFLKKDVGSNYRIVCDVKLNSIINANRWAGFCFRTQESKGWYKLNISTGESTKYNVYTATEISGGSFYELGSYIYPEKPKLGEWYTMEINAYESSIYLSINGKYTHSFKLDSKYNFLTGGIGFVSSGCNVSYDNLKVYRSKGAIEPPVSKGATIVDTPQTGIVNPPVIISTNNHNALYDNKAPAVAFLDVDSNGKVNGNDLNNVIDGLSERTIPAFKVGSEDSLEHVASVISDKDILDSNIIASYSNRNLVSSFKAINPTSVGAIDLDCEIENKERALEILKEINKVGANVLILSDDYDRDTVYYYQLHMITVWMKCDSVESIYYALACGVNGILFENPSVLYQIYAGYSERTIIRKPVITGHRGALNFYVQNCINGFKLAQEMGVEQIETDVRITKDGELVLFHDGDLGYLTDSAGNISDKTLEQIREINITCRSGVKEKIPTVEETMREFVGSDMIFIFHINNKTETVVKKMKELIEKYDFYNNMVFMTGGAAILKIMRSYVPEVASSMGDLTAQVSNMPETKDSIEYFIKSLAPDALQPYPYYYNTDGTWNYLYQVAAHGWLSYSSTCSTKSDMYQRFAVFGETAALMDAFEWFINLKYYFDVADYETTLNEISNMTGILEGFDGAYEDLIDGYFVLDGENIVNQTNFITSKGIYKVIPYKTVLIKDGGLSIKYRLYGKPFNLTVK